MAARYWVGGGSSSNWNATTPTNWSSTSGGAGDATVPGATDDVTFDGAGTGNVDCVISANVAILTFTVTSGYTHTITRNGRLSVAGNVTLNTGMTWAGANSLLVTAAATLTSGGVVWANDFALAGSITVTLVGDWYVGNFTWGNGTNIIINKTSSETLFVSGNFTTPTGTNSIAGTANITMNGTGTINGSSVSSIGNAFEFNTSGTITISGLVRMIKSLTVTAGSFLGTSSPQLFFFSSFTNLTINSLFSVPTLLITLAGSSNVAINGTAGFNIGTLTMSTSSPSTFTTLGAGNTYTLNTAINLTTRTNGLKSDSAGTQANLILGPSLVQNNWTVAATLLYLAVTDINSSGGQTGIAIGPISNCTNWRLANKNNTTYNKTFCR